MCRNSICNWLYKGYFNDIEAVLNKATLEILKDSVVKGFNISAIHQFNLRWSFIEYFKGENKMADFLNSVKVNLKMCIRDRAYVKEDGEIIYNYSNVKKILDIYKALCIGNNKIPVSYTHLTSYI